MANKIEGIDSKNMEAVLSFVTALRRKQLTGSLDVSLQTANLLRLVISKSKWTNTEDMIQMVKRLGRFIQEASPTELGIGNTVRRVLWIIRDEHNRAKKAQSGDEDSNEQEQATSQGPSLAQILGSSAETEDYKETWNIKDNVLATLENELIRDELDMCFQNIYEQAKEHIHANEVIMTMGASRTVEQFFMTAGKFRKFELIVVETVPSFSGQQLAVNMAKFGINTTLITDTAMFAMMARVNKVIVGTHAVLANGGLIGISGLHALALAAFHHSVPFVVCTGIYKLSPLFSYEQDAFNDLNSPANVLQFEEADLSDNKDNHVSVLNPAFDYIPPELVSLFVTNEGANNPSYIYRLLSEHYSPADYKL